MTTNEIAAAERVRRVKSGESVESVYPHFAFPLVGYQQDCQSLANLYIAERDETNATDKRLAFSCLGYSPETPGIVKPVTLECACCGSQIRVPFAEYETGKWDHEITVHNIPNPAGGA